MSVNTPSQQTNSPKKTPVHQWIIGIICIIIGLCVVGGLMAKSWHDAKVHQREADEAHQKAYESYQKEMNLEKQLRKR